MARIAKTASRGHHTFYLDVQETEDTWVADDVSSGAIKVDYKLWMYCSGKYYFDWNSKKVWWALNIGGNEYSGNFGTFMSGTTLTITEGSCWVYQTSNGSATHSFSFSIDDAINAKNGKGIYYTPGDIAWSDATSTFTTSDLTLVGPTGNPTCYVKDNQDNSYTIYGNNGTDGTRNSAQSVHIYRSINGGSASYLTARSAKQNVSYKATLPISSGINRYRITAYNVGTQQKGGWGSISVDGGKLNYYSKVGTPTNLNIDSQELDAGNYKIILQATIGSSGNLNDAKGVEFSYWIIGQYKNGKPDYKYVDGSDIGNNVYQATFVTEASNIDIIEMWARTVGSEDRTVYTNSDLTETTNILHSNWAYTNSSNTIITKPGSPQDLTITDNGNNSFKISCEMGDSGTKNTSVNVEIYYTTDGTSPVVANQPAATAKLYTGTLSTDALTEKKIYTGNPIFITANTYIRAAARTVGSHTSYYYSDFTAVKTKSINFYKTPVIIKPLIQTVDGKKLTKKSNISIESQIQLFKHTTLVGYTVGLYKLGKVDPIYTKTTNITDALVQEEDIKIPIKTEPLNLKTYNLKKDDKIYTMVTYVVKNGAGDNISNNTEAPKSDYYLIESSGVMRINNDGSWHEGQVWVNVNGVWKEATDVFVNIDGSWKESI